MKTYWIALCGAIAIASTVSASDVVQQSAGHQTVLKTSHAAKCSTPSAKLSKDCAQMANSRTPSSQHF